ncbi:MAG: purine-nucleoside phosphorylase [Isosphaeraceae bacterium]
MMALNLRERAQAAALKITEAVPVFPTIAVVLGSGLGAFADDLADPVVLSYGLIPHMPTPTVEGHPGKLVVGKVGPSATPVAALLGRFHYYEGHDLTVVTFPIRVLRELGVQTLILTAATGGVRDDLGPGSLVCLSDHLNLIGANPLRGPNDARLGLRFPDMTEVYSPRLRALALEESSKLGIPLSTGVYACMPGPSYETPAEVRMLRTLGADVVGMSTVPEAVVARHAGMEVLAFAAVSNPAAGLSDAPIIHEDVLAAGRLVGTNLSALIARVVDRVEQG